MKVNLN